MCWAQHGNTTLSCDFCHSVSFRHCEIPWNNALWKPYMTGQRKEGRLSTTSQSMTSCPHFLAAEHCPRPLSHLIPTKPCRINKVRIINWILLLRKLTFWEFLNCPYVTQCTTNIVEDFSFSNHLSDLFNYLTKLLLKQSSRQRTGRVRWPGKW